MIDPKNVTDFDRSDEGLFKFWLFCLFVRGKNADIQARKLDQFYNLVKPSYTTLHDVLRGFSYDRIEEALREVKSGQYKTLTSAIYDTVAWLGRHPERLRTMGVDELQNIRGVGPKTARFFVLHTRPNQRIAVLDTHILQYLATKAEVGEKCRRVRRPARVCTRGLKTVFVLGRF